MVSWDTRKPSLAGNARLSHPEICSGDQSNASFSATRHRSSGWLARRHGLGRSARSQARAAVSVARYALRPPWRATAFRPHSWTSQIIAGKAFPMPLAARQRLVLSYLVDDSGNVPGRDGLTGR